jgi:hypothetical protein
MDNSSNKESEVKFGAYEYEDEEEEISESNNHVAQEF